MKNNIQKVKYNPDSNIPDVSQWWSWEEICDGCGKIILNFRDMITTSEPIVKEEDLCLNCWRKRIDGIN